MDKAAKKAFIKDLCSDIATSIIRDIENGKIPDSWDGIEMRWLLSDRSNTNFGELQKRRKKEYNNTVIVNGL